MAEDNASRLGPNEELERLSGLLSRACFEYLWVPEPHRPVAPPVTNILGAHSLCLLFGDERYRAAAVQHEFDCGWHVGVDDTRVGDSRPMHETTPVWPMYEGAVPSLKTLERMIPGIIRITLIMSLLGIRATWPVA